MKSIVTGIIFGLLNLTWLWAGVPVTVQPTDWVGLPEKGKVKHRELSVEGGRKSKVSYLSFEMNFIKSVEEIESIELVLPVRRVKGSGVVHLFWVTSPWKSGKLNYSNRPSNGEKLTSFYVDDKVKGEFLKIDLTQAFRDWGYSPDTNHGILFETYDDLQVEFTKGLMNSRLANLASQVFDNKVPKFEMIFASVGGPAGPKGETGPMGYRGPQGDQGVAGPVGPSGAQGDQGVAGSVGPSGAQGEQGVAGPTGPSGPQGDQGVAGPVGPSGPQGDQGVAGPAGPSGAQGDQGVAGPSGPQGDQGVAGPAGPSGAQGDQGVAGPVGPSGPQGDQGVAGPAGPSGPQGDQGVAGPAGPSGAQGDQGVAGPAGPSGAQGDQGVAGPAGPSGDQGVAGPVGPSGAQGDQGVAGPVGPSGPQGDQGVAGPIGPQGPKGESAGDASGASSLLAQAQGFSMATISSASYANVGARTLVFSKEEATSLLRVRYADLLGTSVSASSFVTASWRIQLNGTVRGKEKVLIESQSPGLHLDMKTFEWLLEGVPAGTYNLVIQGKVSGAPMLIHGYSGIDVDNRIEVLEISP